MYVVSKWGFELIPPVTLGFLRVVLGASALWLVAAGQYDLASMAAGNVLGVALLLVGSATWAGYTVWGLRAVRRRGALRAATYSSPASVPMLDVLAAAELWYLDVSPVDLPLTVESAAAVLYLGLASTAAAWYLWYKGLEYVPAGTTDETPDATAE